jgi:hypothetical protein
MNEIKELKSKIDEARKEIENLKMGNPEAFNLHKLELISAAYLALDDLNKFISMNN